MKIDDKLKEELHLHTLAMGEQQKIREHLFDASNNFDRILEMNTEAERRKIAAQVLQGLAANTAIYEHKLKDQFEGNEPFDAYTYLVDMAVVYADALIAELNKKKDGK
jgi:hypothetical protein